MTFTINAITFLVTSLTGKPLSLEFREEKRTLSGKLRIKQRIPSTKEYQKIGIGLISQADWNNLKPLLNGGFYTCTLTSSGHDFTGSYSVVCEDFPASFNGTKTGINLTLKPA